MKTRAIVAVLAVVAAVLISTANPAQADLLNPKVKVQGTVSCAGYLGLVKWNYGKVRWMYVTGSNGERGWATLSGPSTATKKNYYFQFNKIPSSGKSITVTVEFGCGSTEAGQKKFKKTFGLNRPKVGGSQTRIVCAGSLVRCF